MFLANRSMIQALKNIRRQLKRCKKNYLQYNLEIIKLCTKKFFFLIHAIFCGIREESEEETESDKNKIEKKNTFEEQSEGRLVVDVAKDARESSPEERTNL